MRETFKPYAPSAESRKLIDLANEIIEEYQAMNLILTLRQLYYRFVAQDYFPNSQKSYDNLGAIVSRARLGGLMDWDAIEDRGRQLYGYNHHASPAAAIQSTSRTYRKNFWEGQGIHVEVWVEKQALESIVGRVALQWDVSYYACKGYTSLSEMYEASVRFRELPGLPDVKIIHLGDHDPSGVDMTRDIRERLNDLFGVHVEVERIALNMDQIEEFSPPPNPAKMTDSRAKNYIDTYDTESSWELDAIEPADLHNLISDAIEQSIYDRTMYEARKTAWREDVKLLGQVATEWPAVVKHVTRKSGPRGDLKRGGFWD
jgi:hypothetical protein